MIVLLTLSRAGWLRGGETNLRFISHRGESADAPENTMAAFRLAAERKTAGCECDIYLTADDEIVCIHDGTTTRTTDGALSVSGSTLAELRALDAGSWKGPQYAGERIPTLSELLPLAHDGFEIYVEIKSGTEILPKLAEVMAAEPEATPEHVLFICFSANVIAALRQQFPAYRAYWLTSTALNADGSASPTAASVIATAQACGASGVDAQASTAVTAPYISAVKAAGLSFHVWTVDDASQALTYVERGADTVTTDCGRALADALGQSAAPEPVIHWTFDDAATNSGSGGAAYDAALSGAPVYTNGIDGQALALDGVDDIVSAAYTLADQGTLALWYRPDGFYNYNTVFDNAVNANGWEMWIYESGVLTFRVGSTNNAGRVEGDLNGVTPVGGWYHLAVTWDRAAGAAALYLNGVKQSTGAISNWVAAGGSFYLGGGNAGNTKGRGAVDDVRVYDEVLPAATIQRFAMPVPVIRWTFDGASANSGCGGAAYDAVLSGSPVYTNSLNRRVLTLDGVDNCAGTVYTLPDQGTLALWYRPERFYNYNEIFDNAVNSEWWEMWIYETGMLTFRIKNNGSGQVFCDLNDLGGSNKWYHLAVTWDKAASNTVFYINGVERDRAVITDWVVPGASFYLGGGQAGNMKGTGLMSDVRIYETPLSSNQVQSVFQEQGERVYLPFDGSGTEQTGKDTDAGFPGEESYAAGKVGQAFAGGAADGTTNNAAIPYALTEAGTMAFWYYARGPWYNYQSVFDNAVDPDCWEMWIYNTGVLTFRVKNDGSGDVRYDLDNLEGPNHWYHIAVTWDRAADRVKLFVDGVQRASDTIGGGWVEPGDTVYLGGHSGNMPGTGMWDEVRIFNRALEVGEIASLMAVPALSTGTVMRVQ